ncbi:SDR family oxidoreductase [Catenulispora sp. NF23]|uniref:SDR family oxidoreductase n=1 Tax=Catenulispora pinistramenti TaxID=2705254 RepID=UPI001BA5AB90|nr:SDR family oxidoreductase [Catenulispora pinistramenti]MBS2532282.1 SDR family oxidoreductase [Catenulispora pinistramenti]
MRIVIAGGHGQIALLLEARLSADGHTVQGLLRRPDGAADLVAAGAEPVVFDLESATKESLAEVIRGADAVVFAAGAGGGSSAERKYTVDLGGSVLLADAAELAGVRRFVQISSMGAGAPASPGSDQTWVAYLDAKTKAEDDLRPRDLDWTIIRPGGLLNTPGLGLVRLAPSTGRGTIPRADVANVLAEVIEQHAAVRQTLELVSGDTPISQAVEAWKG